MERRRRALGIRKPGSSKEEKVEVKNSTPVKKKISAEEIIIREGKESQHHQTGSVLPQQITPKHQNVTSLKTDESPLLSPGFQGSLFPRTFGSPEVEVAWDWGCSQVPNDMVTRRRSKRVSRTQPLPVAEVASAVPACPRLLPSQQVSEEENQERLAFYKNVLSKSVKRTQRNEMENSEHDIEEEAVHHINPMCTMPSSRVSSGEKEEQVSALFDDSANELMLECSQAIENQIKNGEINIGPTIKIKIPNKKHPHSPLDELENVNKKVCHGRTKLNLFPEVPTNNLDSNLKNSSNEGQTVNSKLPPNKQLQPEEIILKTSNSSEKACDLENDDDIFMRPTQINQSLALNEVTLSSKNCFDNKVNGLNKNIKEHARNNSIKLQINGETTVPRKPILSFKNNSNRAISDGKPLEGNRGQFVNNNNNNYNNLTNDNDLNTRNNEAGRGCLSTRYDSVDKFRRVKNNIKHLTEPNLTNNTTSKQSARQTAGIQPKNWKSGQKILTKNCNDPKPRGPDFQSLLDDGFDMELSTLDFDSLCCSSQTEELPVQSVPPKLCSQQEIEAKRKAALNRLMMKKKR